MSEHNRVRAEADWPSRDPNVAHEGLVYHAGKWRTLEGAENWRRRNAVAVEKYKATPHGQFVNVMSQIRCHMEWAESRLTEVQLTSDFGLDS